MNFFVYDPGDPEQGEALRERVSAVHSQAVIQSLASLACSGEQKRRILQELGRNQGMSRGIEKRVFFCGGSRVHP